MLTNTTNQEGGTFEADGTGENSLATNNTGLNDSLGETVTVIDTTSLLSQGQMPSNISNQAYSNTIQSRNISSQNAVSNQQALNQLGISVVGKSVNNVGNLDPLESRSSVDVLTNNELAQTILDLKAAVDAFAGGSNKPLSPKSLLDLIKRIIALFKEIEEANAKLKGKGTYEDPYRSNSKIYVDAPIIVGFKGVPPSKVHLGTATNSVKVTS
ncbi:hypothetical protein MLD52_14775 [Puniceicoccaceae bacterium K14]|nr:hypothetical protein [Puniceicoccaceae bacterium K14]